MFNTLIYLMLCYITIGLCKENGDTVANITGPIDMYVVRATVYQVGILTNSTNETDLNANLNTGRQEALTIYHNNGTSVDLSGILDPIVTNVTAEKVVGVAPVTNDSIPWSTLQRFISTTHLQGTSNEPAVNNQRSTREVPKTPVEIVKGAAVIPSSAGVNSIALPPLLSLNRNLSTIPVPIPNVSVVSYAKINTLVHSP